MLIFGNSGNKLKFDFMNYRTWQEETKRELFIHGLQRYIENARETPTDQAALAK